MLKSKTFWGGIIAVVTCAGGVLTGDMSITDAAQIVVPAVLAIFLRHGMAKSLPPGP